MTDDISLRGINPQIATQIVMTSLDVLRDNDTDNRLVTLYLTVKEFVKDLDITDKHDLPSVIFAYYTQCFRVLVMHQNQDASLGKRDLLSDASLSIFDLYLMRPHDVIIRRMIPISSRALHEVIVSRLCAFSAQPVREMINDLSSIALLVQTIGLYVKGHRRTLNYRYVKWVQNFFDKILEGNVISFMKTDAVLNSQILPQIKDKLPVITLS